MSNSRTATKLFTADGNWTCPGGVTRVHLTMCGGGGGGGGGQTAGTATNQRAYGGGGGGAAAVYRGSIAVVPGTTYSIQVGAGGLAGSIAGQGQIGGSTVWNNTIYCIGGTGGGGGTSIGEENCGGTPMLDTKRKLKFNGVYDELFQIGFGYGGHGASQSFFAAQAGTGWIVTNGGAGGGVGSNVGAYIGGGSGGGGGANDSIPNATGGTGGNGGNANSAGAGSAGFVGNAPSAGYGGGGGGGGAGGAGSSSGGVGRVGGAGGDGFVLIEWTE